MGNLIGELIGIVWHSPSISHLMRPSTYMNSPGHLNTHLHLPEGRQKPIYDKKSPKTRILYGITPFFSIFRGLDGRFYPQSLWQICFCIDFTYYKTSGIYFFHLFFRLDSPYLNLEVNFDFAAIKKKCVFNI